MQHEERSNRVVHISYAHLWDEVKCKFAWRHARTDRTRKLGVRTQTLVERGYARLTLADAVLQRARSFSEQVLRCPMKVVGTSATAMWPFILSSIPQDFKHPI